VDGHPEHSQERLEQTAAGDAGGRLARGRPLEDVADVGLLVLLGADQVSVAGPREMDLCDVLLDRPGIHPLLPVGVVAIGDQKRDWTAERASVTHPSGYLGGVALDLHASAAAVSQLAARHVDVDVARRQLEAGRQPLDDAGQAGTMRLAGRYEMERHGPKLIC
jgi:hypothetical protein